MSNPNPENQWKPGESGNPKGGPKKDNSMRAILEEIGKEIDKIKDKDGKELTITKKKLLAKRWFLEALKGDLGFGKLIVSYTDGMPKQPITGEDGKSIKINFTNDDEKAL